MEVAAPPRPTRAPGTEVLARFSLPLFLDSSAEALLLPGLAHVHAGGAEPRFCPPRMSAELQGTEPRGLPPRADPLPGRPKLPEKGGGGWRRRRERAPAEVAVKSRRHGRVPTQAVLP